MDSPATVLLFWTDLLPGPVSYLSATYRLRLSLCKASKGRLWPHPEDPTSRKEAAMSLSPSRSNLSFSGNSLTNPVTGSTFPQSHFLTPDTPTLLPCPRLPLPPRVQGQLPFPPYQCSIWLLPALFGSSRDAGEGFRFPP